MKKSKKTNKEKILSDCRPDWTFWLCNGTSICNIYELANSIEAADDSCFSYHANKEKNDFAKWIKEVLEDKKLAKQLEKEIDKAKFVNKIRKRIKELEK